MRSLRIAVAQPLTVARDVTHNAGEHARLIQRADARVVVFPEMSLTGYEFDAPVLDSVDPRLEAVRSACTETGSIALAGAPVAGPNGGRSIGTLRIDQNGASVVYRKMWLGEAEKAHFEPGVDPTVIDVDGWRVGLAVCKDTGVPQHAADTVALGIDVYAAGVLEHDADRDVQPQRARRICRDHRVWVAIASFAGSTGEGFDHAAGGSTIWNPVGDTVTCCDEQAGTFTTATVI